MNYQVKVLTLYKDLCFSKKESENLESLFVYKNLVSKNNLEPQLSLFLQDEVFCGYKSDIESKYLEDGDYIPEGKYLFVQGFSSEFTDFLKATESIFLEALWQEIEFCDDKVFLRKLKENEKTVFQVFRRIKASS